MAVKALGCQYPHPFHVRPDGLKVPNGTIHATNHQGNLKDYNEFIVYNEAQVKMRYLVKFKFRN